MSDLSLFYGPNAGYALELYERYRQDPNSVDEATRTYFDSLPVGALEATVRTVSAPSSPRLPDRSSQPPAEPPCNVTHVAAAARLARFIRQRGHLEADLDPLDLTPQEDAGLELEEHALTEADLAALPSSVVGGPIAKETSNALEAIQRLRQVYSGPIGYDDEHIECAEERYWLRDAAEGGWFYQAVDAEHKRALLQRLTEVDTFEQYINKTWPGQKRFSIEGTDLMVPMLDEIIRNAASTGIHQVVLGMAHRGRLNVLAHVLGKPYKVILAAFDDTKQAQSASVSGGDVKYHQGYERIYREGGVEMPISLLPNPSHLEFVNAVAEGHARAAQEDRTQPGKPTRDNKGSLPILIHGDAAFPGQGIVSETLNLSRLPGYSTSGTIHIIANNQIGFTTLPGEGRSTLYAGDLARGFEVPIVHVNADDVLACIAVARMACAYREKFQKDFLIDLIGYRRYGHNESDEPAFTQPKMYQMVASHPRVRDLWAQQLEREGIVTREASEAMIANVWKDLLSARNAPVDNVTPANGLNKGSLPRMESVETGVPKKRLIALNTALTTVPAGFEVDSKIEKNVLVRRREGLTTEKGIDWGHAEALAFASILEEGTPIRLTGQDSERGTFVHRNAVLHNPETGASYVPLQHLPTACASFDIHNSPLSESAVMGFEYGYCIRAKGVLTLWEAQFGDFANGAQVIIDQFVVPGHAKWGQTPSLVLLLPHGYEGQGPEHSSARLERFLQLAANDEICIANCTTPAQFFHLLRRQAALVKTDPRPLIVMTPKNLLRHPRAASSLADLTAGTFQTVIDDVAAQERADQVTRLILCSGKVYVDLIGNQGFKEAIRVAAARVEQLYPFPVEEIRNVIAGYPNLRELVWMQEEPRNMGAWSFVAPRLRENVEWNGTLIYVGRPESTSPAEGSIVRHQAEQNRIITTALEAPLDLPPFEPELVR